MSPERAAAYARLLPRYSIEAVGPQIDLTVVFSRSAPRILDVGFGGGESVIELATARRHEDVIGVEVHTPGIGRVLEAVESLHLDNVRVVEGDALELVDRLPLGSLDGIRVFFPDPWPKVRQHRRRMLRPQIVTELVDRLTVGGWLHVATDVVSYAMFALASCNGDERLHGGIIDRPSWRPVTRFEERAHRDGRSITDLWFERVS
jgi:tRNA (guanine-N7-)-methyltransferase